MRNEQAIISYNIDIQISVTIQILSKKTHRINSEPSADMRHGAELRFQRDITL